MVCLFTNAIHQILPSGGLMYRFIALFICIFMSMGQDVYANAERELTYYVTDNTRTLSDYELKALDKQIQLLEQKNGIQAKVLLVKSTQPESIEAFAENVFATTKLGDTSKDNGLLLIIALEDRKMRFEVGYGLEGKLTDLKTAQIIKDSLVPAFRKNQIFQGISSAIKSVDAILSGSRLELDLQPTEEQASSEPDQDESMRFINPITHPFFLILFAILQIALRNKFSKRKSILISILPALIMASILMFSHNTSVTFEMIKIALTSFVILIVLTYFVGDHLLNVLLHMKSTRLPTGRGSGSYSTTNRSNTFSGSSSRRSAGPSSSSGRSRSSGRGGKSGGGGASGSW